MYETTTQPKGTKPKTRAWTYTKEQIGTLPAIISKEEVSHIVGVSTRTVTRLANDNRIHGPTTQRRLRAICILNEQFGISNLDCQNVRILARGRKTRPLHLRDIGNHSLDERAMGVYNELPVG